MSSSFRTSQDHYSPAVKPSLEARLDTRPKRYSTWLNAAPPWYCGPVCPLNQTEKNVNPLSVRVTPIGPGPVDILPAALLDGTVNVS